MIERHFVLNLDRINGERNAEHPGKKQEIIRGKAFMHYFDKDADGAPGNLTNMLVLAIERSYLQELYAQLISELGPDSPPLDPSQTVVKTTQNLFEYLEDDYYDPDHVYAAIIVQTRIK